LQLPDQVFVGYAVGSPDQKRNNRIDSPIGAAAEQVFKLGPLGIGDADGIQIIWIGGSAGSALFGPLERTLSHPHGLWAMVEQNRNPIDDRILMSLRARQA
jgi:hypothetical protein